MFSKTLVAGTLVLIGTSAIAEQAVMGAAEEDMPAASVDWPLNGGNHRGEHFSALAQIDVEALADLGVAWVTVMPLADGISATPIVIDGVVYVSGPFSIVFALDAKSGEMLWTYDPDVRKSFAADPHLS